MIVLVALGFANGDAEREVAPCSQEAFEVRRLLTGGVDPQVDARFGKPPL